MCNSFVRSYARRRTWIGGTDAWIDSRRACSGTRSSHRKMVDHPATELCSIQHDRTLTRSGHGLRRLRNLWSVRLHGPIDCGVVRHGRGNRDVAECRRSLCRSRTCRCLPGQGRGHGTDDGLMHQGLDRCASAIARRSRRRRHRCRVFSCFPCPGSACCRCDRRCVDCGQADRKRCGNLGRMWRGRYGRDRWHFACL